MAIRKHVDQYEPMVSAEYIGEPGDVWVDLETNKLFVGDAQTEGGNAVVTTASNGINDMGGDLWIGNINDNDSVVWAGPDSEYAALWWSGTRTVDEPGYGPYAGIHVGIDSADDMDNSYPPGTQITFNVGSDWEWRMLSTDGSFHAAKDITIDGSEGQFLARQSGGGANGGYSFIYDGSYDTGMFSPNDGIVEFYTNNVQAFRLLNGGAQIPVKTSPPTGDTGMLATCDGSSWNGGGDGLQHLMIYINGGWTKVV
jgi:hypothetical protein